jgi:hypothetical protein
MFWQDVEVQQRKICKLYKTDFVPCEESSKLGIALATLELVPTNGLRHAPEKGTNGWYIWGGKELSLRPDFFDPLHVQHLTDRCPLVLKYLGLPPGYRFLLTGDYVDVWFDVSLLNTANA